HLPWGTGSVRAGIALGAESATLGPSAFDIGPDRSIVLLDGAQGRLAFFVRDRLVRSVPVGAVSPDADVAAARNGTAYVLSSSGGRASRPVTLRRVPRASPPGPPVMVGRGLPVAVSVVGRRPFVHLLPMDEWFAAAAGPGSSLTPGRPLGAGDQLLSVARRSTVRLGTVVRGRVHDAVELSFPSELGELALAAPDG